ncbi:AP5M1 protein, partial [Polypterus senegalus]
MRKYSPAETEDTTAAKKEEEDDNDNDLFESNKEEECEEAKKIKAEHQTQRYPTVEIRARRIGKEHYVSIPEDTAFVRSLLTELGLTDPEKPFVEARDGCDRMHKTSALELKLDQLRGDVLWPVLAIQHGKLILACLPLVEAPLKPRPSLPSLPSISQGFSLLAGLQAFLTGVKAEGDLTSRLGLLSNLLLHACPLGSPLETNLSQTVVPPASLPGTQKQPAWKPGIHKGRAQVAVAISEQVRSMQYGNPSKPDTWDVFGTVSCKCDLEGVLPNVTVTLSLPPNGSPLQDIVVHHCVTSLDSSVLTASSVDESDSSAFSGPYKFPFSPPLEPFRLCCYTSQVPVPPILGSYQLIEELGRLKVTVNLKLHESVKNGFEYCEVQLPFFNRGQLASVDLRVTTGQLEVTRERDWWFGCLLHFRVPDITLSGCSVDQHSVQVYSSAKPKIVTYSVDENNPNVTRKQVFAACLCLVQLLWLAEDRNTLTVVQFCVSIAT